MSILRVMLTCFCWTTVTHTHIHTHTYIYVCLVALWSISEYMYVCIYIYIYIYSNILLYLNHSLGVECDTRPFFKQGITVLNLFSFSKTRLKNQVYATIYLQLVGGGDRWIYFFPQSISAMLTTSSLVQDLNSGRRLPFLRRKTVTIRVLPRVCILQDKIFPAISSRRRLTTPTLVL